MVKRHSTQMMDLLKQEQEELHRMIEAEIVSGNKYLSQFIFMYFTT